jgi:hypothetical protein
MPPSDIIASSDRQKIVEIARRILDGSMSIIAGSRQLRAFCGGHGRIDEFDPDFLTFVGIDSETDDLPVGESRHHWAAQALAKKDVEIARCEDLYRDVAREVASRLVARFAK